MKTVEIKSISDLILQINSLPNNYIFRGQADASWQLQSSLERVLAKTWSKDRARHFEDFTFKQFCPKFHLYDKENSKPNSKLAWLSIMQHYGVPTRLLDFSESPYIALYFAMESAQISQKKDLSLYALDYSGILEKSIEYIRSKDSDFRETIDSIQERQDKIFEETVDRFSYEIIWIGEPAVLNTRLDRQAGSFILSGDREKKIEEVLNSKLYSTTQNIKFVIDGSLYDGIFALLRKVNITSKSIYGDLEGLARSIKMQMQIYAI